MSKPVAGNRTTDDPLKGPKLRIERAHQFIDEFEAIQNGFLNRNPIEVFEEPHPDGLHKFVKLRLTEVIDDHISILVGDACASLRSALDQLAVALARLNGAKSIGDVYFPIAGSLEDFESPATQRKIGKLSSEAIKLIASFKPYKGGNDDLWSLSKLRVVDFHHNLIGVSANCMPLIEDPQSVDFNWRRSIETGVGHSFGGFPWDFVNHSMIAAIAPKESNIKDHLSVALNIIFREPDTLDGLPVFDKLYNFSHLVEHIILTFQKRFF